MLVKISPRDIPVNRDIQLIESKDQDRFRIDSRKQIMAADLEAILGKLPLLQLAIYEYTLDQAKSLSSTARGTYYLDVSDLTQQRETFSLLSRFYGRIQPNYTMKNILAVNLGRLNPNARSAFDSLAQAQQLHPFIQILLKYKSRNVQLDQFSFYEYQQDKPPKQTADSDLLIDSIRSLKTSLSFPAWGLTLDDINHEPFFEKFAGNFARLVFCGCPDDQGRFYSSGFYLTPKDGC